MSEKTENIGDTLSKFVSLAAQKAMQMSDEENDHPLARMNVLMCAAMPAMGLMTLVLGKCPSGMCDSPNGCCENPTSRLTPQSLFFVALVCAYSAQGVGRMQDEGKYTTVPGHFSLDQEVFLRAAEAYKLLNGVAPDRFLIDPLVKAFRKSDEESQKALNAIMAKLEKFRPSENEQLD